MGRGMTGARATLVALVVGLLAGAVIKAWGPPEVVGPAKALAPIGALWLKCLQMTILPLIFALVVSAIGSWSNFGGGRSIGLTLGLFLAMLLVAALLGVGVAEAMLQLWPPAPGALDVLKEAHSGPAPAVPTLSEELLSLIPSNPVAAAASGNIAAVVVFALALGAALARVPPERRQALGDAVKALGEAMMTVVAWVLKLAPVGVFVLSLELALSSGFHVAGVLVQVNVLRMVGPAIGIALCYLIVRLFGGLSFGRFARGALAPQAVAAGCCSSMATLPSMIDAAERELGISAGIAGAVLPLAVSTFRFGNVILITGTALYVAGAAGVHPTMLQIAMAVVVVIVTNFGIAGLPAAAVIYAAEAPAFQLLGAPIGFLPLLIATAGLADIVDTTCNVTGDLTVTALINRLVNRPSPAVTDAAAALERI